jgi:hypothetical protein
MLGCLAEKCLRLDCCCYCCLAEIDFEWHGLDLIVCLWRYNGLVGERCGYRVNLFSRSIDGKNLEHARVTIVLNTIVE